MSNKRKRLKITGSWVAHSAEMRESPAWSILPDNARRILDRLEREHMRHGGAENGALRCTYSDFEEAGVRRASVAVAIRQCEELGFVEVVRKGYTTSNLRHPSLYRLTHVCGCGKSPDPTNEWRRFKSFEQAQDALARAVSPRPNRHRSKNSGRINEPTSDAIMRLKQASS